MSFNGKIAVITGGARGIGAACARAFLAAGADVLLADIDANAANETAEQMRQQHPERRVEVFQLDTRQQAECFAMADYAVQQFGRIDIQLHAAGIVDQGPSLDVTQGSWERLIGINLNGVFFCCQAAGRVMRDQGGGVIVNISSVSARAGLPKRASYVAAKAAVNMLTETLAVEWAPYKIRVNAVGPGWVATDIVKKSIERGVVTLEQLEAANPTGRIAQPEEIASVALFLSSEQSAFITGQVLYVDGGYLAGAPFAALR